MTERTGNTATQLSAQPPVLEFVAHLRSLGVDVQVAGDQLRVRAQPGVLTPELKAELGARKQEVLQHLRQVNGHVGQPRLQQRPRGPEPLPLSYAQQRLWFIEQLEPGLGLYNMPSVFRLRGALNVAALERSLAFIVARHESLRTCIVMENGDPHQVIRPAGSFGLALVDLTTAPPAERESLAEALTRAEARRPFDLATGPLLRPTLLRLADDDHLLALVVHHIASDGWSSGVLWHELRTLYAAYAAGAEPELPPLPIQYADYAVWQRNWLQGERLAGLMRYWREQLDGLAPLQLPTDRMHSAAITHQGASVRASIPPALAERLRSFCRQEQVTLYMALLAVFDVLLGRYSGQSDIAVGTPIAGRLRAELEPLIGLFLNTLVMRTDLSGNPTFLEVVRRVQETALAAYDHQEVPFEKLVEELQPERRLDRVPFVNVLFNMQPESSSLELPGLCVERIQGTAPVARFDFTMYVNIHADTISLALVYRTALFSAERMAEFLRQYVHLLEQALFEPDRPVGDYSLVTDHAARFVPNPRWPLAVPSYPGAVAEFLRRAADQPAHPAVEQGTQAWTYGELAHAARRVAAWLQGAGLRRGAVAALAGPRSFELLAGMLGITLAGGVFLPLALDLPPNRRQAMLDEARARYSLEALEDTAGEGGRRSLVLRCLAEPARDILLDADGVAPYVGAAPGEDEPAYIFFTSGSTGRPKGILGWHRGLNHFVDWQRRNFAIHAGDRVAWLTHLSFDPVLRDLFLPLCSGATLCLPPREGMAPEEELAWLAEAGVTVVHVVPSRARYWLRSLPMPPRLAVRVTFFAGEPLMSDLVERWRSLCPAGSQVVNLYGPTETTLAKACYVGSPPLLAGIQPVGQALPETQLWIVNQARQLCGVGEPGEIVVRTPFRTLGYIHPTAEDAARFQANWFTGDGQDLVFVTGDLGRYRPDGSISILGRKDHQVKVGGVRVELEEVEAVLGRHGGVRACAVAAGDGDDGVARLTAYVEPAELPLDVAALRRHLLDWLPAAMTPAVFVIVDPLPRLTNGKVDRTALRRLAVTSIEPSTAFVSPSTPVEQVLAQIWCRVLQREQVGVEDDFFQLGGHSLAAMRVLTRIQSQLGVSVGLRAFFERPTIAGLAAAILTGTVADLAAAERNRLMEEMESQA